MNIELKKIREGFDGNTCYAQSRIGSVDNEGNHLVLTSQKLILAGSDTYKLIESMFSTDGGESWTEFIPQKNFETDDRIVCDFVPCFHKKTGKLLGMGGSVSYKSFNPPLLDHTKPQQMFYSVYDIEKNEWDKIKKPVDKSGNVFSGFSSACCRRFELENGDILQPVYRRSAPGEKTSAQVMRFGFDGETIILKEEGNLLSCESEKRGFAEPSMAYYNGVYYLTIRADSKGYIATSSDGLNFSEPIVWNWDTGLIVPTYNTQQNWVVRNDGLYLVYTRKDGKNDHVFRNRAPLYMCKVDTENLCLIRETEVAITPERGARMGNFGVTHISNNKSIVVTTEWMQPVGCEKYGSNNAIYAVFIM